MVVPDSVTTDLWSFQIVLQRSLVVPDSVTINLLSFQIVLQHIFGRSKWYNNRSLVTSDSVTTEHLFQVVLQQIFDGSR